MSYRYFVLLLSLFLTVNAAKATPINEWAIWGPAWSRGGLAVTWLSHEGDVQPQPGDLDRTRGWVGQGDHTWQYLQTQTGMIDWLSAQVPDVSEHLAKTNKWAGATVYAHTYIWADQAQPAKLNYAIKGSHRIWLNGDRISDSKVRLHQGWNRLLVSMHSPAMINGRERKFATDTNPSNWTMQFAIVGTQENDIDNVRFTAFDPTRTTMLTSDNRPMRMMAMLTRPDGESPIYFANESVSLHYDLQVGLDEPENKRDRRPWYYTVTPKTISAMMDKRAAGVAQYRITPDTRRFSPDQFKDNLPAKVRVRVYSYDNMPVMDQMVALTFDAEKQGVFQAQQLFRLGKLPVNHYRMYNEYLTSDDKVMLRHRPHSFSVVQGPVAKDQDTGPRVLATVGHWLLKKDMDGVLGRMRLLWRSGITRQHKINQGWSTWGLKHDGKGNVTLTPNPAIDQLIDEANRLGITLVGDLSTGYIRTDLLRDGKAMPQTEAEQNAAIAKAKDIVDPKQLVLAPYGARSSPHFGHPAFEKTYEEAARLLVSHYKGRIDYWTGDNETDLHAGKATEQIAEVYATAVKALYRGLKDANPNAVYISPSVCRKNEFTYKLQKFGFMDACDILDVHAHPIDAPDLDSPVIGNSTKEGLGVVIDYLKESKSNKPVWYGELSAPVSHSFDGAQGQVESLIKQLAWAINNEHVQGLSYLVVYNGYDYSWPSGMCNLGKEPLPAINAINTASHLLDGRKKLAPLSHLNGSIQQLRVADKAGNQTLLLWNHTDTKVWIKVKDQVQHVDLLGINRTTLTPNSMGMVQVEVGKTPVYLVGRFVQ
ncbi:MAG: hypothetical protein ACF8OB_00750 [Phycisphaeraceae bacterium JB051]